MTDLNELSRLEAAATPGPWVWRSFGGEQVLCSDQSDRKIVISGGYTRNDKGFLDRMIPGQPVSDLICVLRNNARGLIECARALEWYATCEQLHEKDLGDLARATIAKFGGKT